MNFDRQKMHQFVFYAASILIAVTLPLNEYEGIKLNSLAIILLIANWLLEGDLKQKFKSFFNNKWALLFSAVYLVNLVGLLYTENFQEGIREVTVKLSLLVMPLVYSTSVDIERTNFKKVLFVFIFSTVAVTFYLFKDGFVYTFGDMYNPHHITILHREILGRVYCSVYLSFVVFIVFLCFFNAKRICLFGNSAVLLCLMYIVYVQGILIVKMTIAALFLTALFLLFIYLNDIGKRKLAVVLSVLFLAGVFLSYLTNPRIQEIAYKSFTFQNIEVNGSGMNFEITSFSARHDIWGAALRILHNNSNWITGIGTGDVPDSLVQTYQQMNLPSDTYDDPHNEYMSSLLRNGILGLLILLASIFFPLYWSIRHHNYLYTSFLLLSLFCMITESWLSRQSGVVFYAFFNSFLFFNSFNKTNKK